MLLQQGSGLPSPGLIVGVDAAYVLILPLDGHHRDLELGQLLGGEGMAQHDHTLDLVGKQLLDVPALTLLIVVADKHQKFIAKGLIGGQDLVEHLGIEAVVKLRHDDPDEFRLPHGQNTGHPVLMIIQLLQRL